MGGAGGVRGRMGRHEAGRRTERRHFRVRSTMRRDGGGDGSGVEVRGRQTFQGPGRASPRIRPTYSSAIQTCRLICVLSAGSYQQQLAKLQ